MAKRWVSRHGLSGCPRCGQHIKLTARWQLTVCPFCGASVTQPRAARQFPGRGGLLAIGFLSAGVGCAEDPRARPDPEFIMDDGVDQGAADAQPDSTRPDAAPHVDMAPPIDMTPPPVDMAPPPVDMAPPPIDMAPPVDMALPPIDMAQPPLDMAPDVSDQPAYGGAPDPDPVGPAYGEPPIEDAGLPDLAPAQEPEASPDYGLPPIEEIEPVDPDAGVDMANAIEAGIMPEYGAPPVPPLGGQVAHDSTQRESSHDRSRPSAHRGDA